jgi:hypothetical protein
LLCKWKDATASVLEARDLLMIRSVLS